MHATPLRSLIPKLPEGILYGGDYNPEQWSEDVWAEDARLMREAGVNIVSLGIFSWVKIEPEPGRYELDWLERVIDLLWKHDVSICLATATAAPPAWLSRLHPDSLPLGPDGQRFTHGSRQHYCPNSTAYREASAGLATQIARRLGHHPAVALWHINNEIGCHINACYCPVCTSAFQSWLRERHGSLDVLNDVWHTQFWEQTYGDWSEISLPGRTPSYGNPAQLMDHHRFVNDSMRHLLENEIAAVRAVVPDARITTNGVFVMKSSNYRDWYRLCDVAALDCYPDPHAGLPDAANGLRLAGAPADQPAVPCAFFSEVVHLRGAEALATFTDDFLAGGPALTRHQFGQGEAFYLATQPDQAFLDAWLGDLLATRGIHAPVKAGPSVEISPRWSDKDEFLFVINHDRTPAAVDYEKWSGAGDLLDEGRPVPAHEDLPPFAVRILRRPVTT